MQYSILQRKIKDKVCVWFQLKKPTYFTIQLIFVIIHEFQYTISLTFIFIYSIFSKKFSISAKYVDPK